MQRLVSIITAATLATHMMFGCCDADCSEGRHGCHDGASGQPHAGMPVHDCDHDHDGCPAHDGEQPVHDGHHCVGGCAFLLTASTSIDSPDVLPASMSCLAAGAIASGQGSRSPMRTARLSDPPPTAVPLFLALRTLLI